MDHVGPIPMPEIIKKKSRYPVFYTYVSDVEFAQQPYYNMSSEAVGLEPGTLRPWLIMPNIPSKTEQGKVIDLFGPITLSEDKVWVMGDNRKNSRDSRFWSALDKKLISGRASFIVYSIDSEEPFWLFELIKSPMKFWSKSVRWDRIFKKLWLDEQKEIKHD